ncbi:MAG: D-tyrosyl-tRNA(Tyr) deacylase [Verrucomicrobia bacterium]|nr:D-tyrosyl-tRNA(Tyr) deacylase [Verrucomicrobiota bacterium]MCG2679214.1 D-aminoacyl-tRNA deacylase [Kiritimatiellia bacterium]MBU4248607.1 D-tyrosyl-tRNA(Tyr) deacylase [Verrucomicrobiota bacterium]MBU4290069.1 D-tyrosyl-tRNA(Tyr) deacylase [Verrucomicrobiota bacterium]MBU4430345.1 D-tyrosyl-tRNA(Tyr) deacylase [Verrucomicrobiota bacterium]
MKAWIQRVRRGKVSVNEGVISEIGRGYVVLLGVKKGDTEADAQYLADKTAALRIFPDEQERMNRSIIEVEGSVLVVSQFTLHADTRKGNRPSFILAAPAEEANRLYEYYVDCLRHILGPERVATGRFQAMMLVEIVNDGPVSIELKSRSEEKD